MTVLNEEKFLKSYTYLEYVEFLDMICRYSIIFWEK